MKIRTDLAIECREMFAEEISGVESSYQDSDGITVTHVKITTEEGAQKIGKPIGNYVTIEIKNLNCDDDEIYERGANAVCEELKKIINIEKKAPVLVAGLGNRYITPDSIGPKTVGKVLVTRHITGEIPNEYSFSIRPVSAVSPGVLALTGIETSEAIFAISEKIKPSLIIAVDALASRNLSRLGTTVQISDTGICPGSGVGNNRKALTKETMGIPVIAIGVPMVVDALTVALDAIDTFSDYMEKDGEKNIFKGNLKENQREALGSVLSDNNINMIVTPNDVDVISNQASDIIAEGINRALHPEK